MKQVKVSPVIIDWVTAVGLTARHGSWMRKMLSTERSSQTYKGYHQTHAVEYYPSFAKHYYSPHIVDSPSIFVMSGECLGNIRNEHDNDWCNKVVSMLARSSSHFSRIDLAIDIFDNGLLAHEIATFTLFEKQTWGRRGSRVVSAPGPQGGCTLYVGSRTSPKFMRVYDKNAESKGVVPSSRVEFELKGEAAERVTSILSQPGGWTQSSRLFNGLLGEFGDWSQFPSVEALQYGDVITLNLPKRERMSEKKEWLTRQVLPSFVKEADGKGQELWQWFKEVVETGLGA